MSEKDQFSYLRNYPSVYEAMKEVDNQIVQQNWDVSVQKMRSVVEQMSVYLFRMQTNDPAPDLRELITILRDVEIISPASADHYNEIRQHGSQAAQADIHPAYDADQALKLFADLLDETHLFAERYARDVSPEEARRAESSGVGMDFHTQAYVPEQGTQNVPAPKKKKPVGLIIALLAALLAAGACLWYFVLRDKGTDDDVVIVENATEESTETAPAETETEEKASETELKEEPETTGAMTEEPAEEKITENGGAPASPEKETAAAAPGLAENGQAAGNTAGPAGTQTAASQTESETASSEQNAAVTQNGNAGGNGNAGSTQAQSEEKPADNTQQTSGTTAPEGQSTPQEGQSAPQEGQPAPQEGQEGNQAQTGETSPSAAASTEAAGQKKTFTVTAVGLNVREDASAATAVLGQLQRGETVTATGEVSEDGRWTQIYYPDEQHTGWVSTSYLE